VGEGGEGLGRERLPGAGANRIVKRVPRNAPALFNLGAREVRVLFHDGRLSPSDLYPSGFNSPAWRWMPEGLDSIVAAQALLPLTSAVEMAGNKGENEVAGAINDRIDHAWRILAKRVRGNDVYARMLLAAFPDLDGRAQIDITHVANALGAFVTSEWRSVDSAWDRHLVGAPLPPAAERGKRLFFGRARCADCHSGKFFTDQEFHALALPQFGPGRTRPFDPIARDLGRMGETDRIEDAYRFRTPSLRNVARTAPYGHNGAYPTLEGIIRHHLSPLDALAAWGPENAVMPPADWLSIPDFVALQDRREQARLASKVDIQPVSLTDGEIADLIAFLTALTGGDSLKGRLGRPSAVPSGLPVD
jgi:cytochrome c peroxidase